MRPSRAPPARRTAFERVDDEGVGAMVQSDNRKIFSPSGGGELGKDPYKEFLTLLLERTDAQHLAHRNHAVRQRLQPIPVAVQATPQNPHSTSTFHSGMPGRPGRFDACGDTCSSSSSNTRARVASSLWIACRPSSSAVRVPRGMLQSGLQAAPTAKRLSPGRSVHDMPTFTSNESVPFTRVNSVKQSIRVCRKTLRIVSNSNSSLT